LAAGRERRSPLKSLASLIALAVLAGSTPTVDAGSGAGSTNAAFLISGCCDPELGRSLAESLRLDPERLCLFRREGGALPGQLTIRDPRPLPPVALSARADLVAYSTWREVSCDPAYTLRVHFAVVVDTTGEESAVLPGVWEFAWSPEGDRLAVVYGHAGPRESCVPDSIGVIDIRTRRGTTFALQAATLSWSDSETLVLRSSRVQELDLRSGEVRTTRRRDGLLSPDSRYSLSTWREDGAPRVADDATGTDLTGRIHALFGKGGVDVVSPPFWAGGDSPGHLLCLPVRRPSSPPPAERRTAYPPPSYSVEIVDVAQCRILRSIPGIGLAATPDRRAVVIYRDGGLTFEDL
jgi:hypothetical protein